MSPQLYISDFLMNIGEIMKNLDFLMDDCDSSAPDIDVEINICETVNDVEVNELSKSIDEHMRLAALIEEQIDETNEVIGILRNNELTPTALKILSANSTYIDSWGVSLPSVESLNKSDGKVMANQIADLLSAKVEKAELGLESLWSTIGEKVSDFWEWLTNFFRNNEEIINRTADKVKNTELDREKVDRIMIKSWDISTVQAYTQEAVDIITSADKLIVDATTGKITNELGEKVRNFIQKSKIREIDKEKTEKPLSELADDIILGRQGEFYKCILQLNKVAIAYKVCFDKINKALEEAKKIHKKEDKLLPVEDDGIGLTSGISPMMAYTIAKAMIRGVIKLFTWLENYGRKRAIRLMERMVKNYLAVCDKVYDCRVRD